MSNPTPAQRRAPLHESRADLAAVRMHVPRRKWTGARLAYIYSAIMSVWLLSGLPVWSALDSAERESAAYLVVILLGSIGIAFNLGRAQRGTRYAAFVLGLLGAFLLTRTLGLAIGVRWEDAGPALVISYVLVCSAWASLVIASILVLRPAATETISAERAG